MNATAGSKGEFATPTKTSEFPRSNFARSAAGNVVSLGKARDVVGSDGAIQCTIFDLRIEDWPRPQVDHPKARAANQYVVECEQKGRGAALAAARRRLAAGAGTDGGRKSLKELRLARGLSQTELARLMETSQSRVARLEAGREEPKLSTLQKLSSALGVDFNTLMEAF